MVQLRSNKIPRGLEPLEFFFDDFDTFKGSKVPDMDEQVIEVNVGFKESPRAVKIGLVCTPLERKEIKELVREYIDVFAKKPIV